MLRKIIEISQPIARCVLNYCNVKYRQLGAFVIAQTHRYIHNIKKSKTSETVRMSQCLLLLRVMHSLIVCQGTRFGEKTISKTVAVDGLSTDTISKK